MPISPPQEAEMRDETKKKRKRRSESDDRFDEGGFDILAGG